MLSIGNRTISILNLVSLIAILGYQPALAETWQSNTPNSQLEFAASYQGLPINGRFNQFSVTCLTDQLTQPTQLNVAVSINSADMGSSEFNQAIQAADWFNVADFSEATFSSQNLESVTTDAGAIAFIAHGILQLKGLQKTIAVPLSWQKNSADQVTITGEIILDRSDFAIGTGEWASGDQIGLAVRVWFTVQLDNVND